MYLNHLKTDIFYLCIIVVHIVNFANFIKLCSLKGSINIKFSVIETSVFLLLFLFCCVTPMESFNFQESCN